MVKKSLTRRKFCKITSALGLSSLTTQFGDKHEIVKALENDKVRYVARVKNNRSNGVVKKEPIYETTSVDEWIRRYTALDARSKIQNEVDQKFDSNLIKPDFVPMKDSSTGFGVEVKYTTLEDINGEVYRPEPDYKKVRDELPTMQKGRIEIKESEHVRRAPVKIRKIKESQLSCDTSQCVDDTEWSDVPGGSPCAVNGSVGTINGSFDDPDYGMGLIISGHVASSKGNDVYQFDDSIGTVKRKNVSLNNDIDYAFVNMDSNEGVSHYIVNKDNSTKKYPIKRIVTDDALKNDAGTDTVYYTQGQTTCQISGNIIGVGGLGSTYVTSTHNANSGDSGGPLFYLIGDDAYISGVVAKGFNDEDNDGCGEDTKSTTAETVENKIGGNYT